MTLEEMDEIWEEAKRVLKEKNWLHTNF
jgi:hypothetical protein